MGFFNTIIVFTMITCISVIGLYIMTGLTGMFSLGQAAMMAVGAYTAALLMKRCGLPFPLAAVCAIIAALIMAFIISVPIMKLRRDYFALVTMAMGEAMVSFLNAASGLTGGALGLTAIPKHTTSTLVAVTLVVLIFLARNFRRSRFGRMAIATRSDELAAGTMGINNVSVKTRSFLMAAAFSALAGCYYASFVSFIDPSMFAWRKSGEWITMMFFGGVSSLTGSMSSTVLLTALPEALRFTDNYRYVIYAVLVLLVISFRPDGLLGQWEISDLFRKKSAKSKAGPSAAEEADHE